MGYSTVEADVKDFARLTHGKVVIESSELQWFYNTVDILDITRIEVGDNNRVYVEMGKEFAVFE